MNQTLIPTIEQIEADPHNAIRIANAFMQDIHKVISCKACELETNKDENGAFVPCTHEEVESILSTLLVLEKATSTQLLV